MLVSYVIPAYNCEATLAQCIRHVQAQPGEKEVIVVVDGDNPELTRICAESGAKYAVIPHSGAAVARNTGMALAAGDYVCLVDSDAFLEEGYSLKLLSNDFSEWDIVTSQGYNTYISAEKHPPRMTDQVVSYHNQIVMGVGAVVPRRMLPEFTFDEDFIVGGEDVALLYKLLRGKARIKLQLDATFAHTHKAKSGRQRVMQYLRRRLFFAYGELLVYLKCPMKGDLGLRVWNNLWAAPFLPFILGFVRIKRALNRPALKRAIEEYRGRYGASKLVKT